MKRILFLFSLLCLTALGLYSQGSIMVNPPILPQGYQGVLAITGTGTNFHYATCGINLRLIHTGGQAYDFGTAPSGMGWIPGNPAPNQTFISGNIQLPINAPMGFYTVELRGYSGFSCGPQNMFVSMPNLLEVGPASLFKGQVVLDRDSSCTRNGTDVGLGNHLVTITPGPYYAMTDNDGYFEAGLFPGTYDFSIAAPSGADLFCPTGPRTATVALAGDSVSGIDFFVVGSGWPELQATLISGPHRPGFSNAHSFFEVRNIGFEPAQNVVATLTHPSSVTGLSYDLTPTTTTSSFATWNLGTLNGGASVMITSTGSVNFMPLGSQWTYTGQVATTSQEETTTNNTASGIFWITGAYDPNDKQVWTADGRNADGAITASDSLLRYLIRFQNTGNDTAFNIHIMDTLDTDLDVSTLHVESASHPYEVAFTDSSGYRVKFLFPNVLLPDSNRNEPKSHGYIQYTIRQPGNLPVYTEIKNRASIYFDFNPPVVTNMVKSRICQALGNTFSATGIAPTVDFVGPSTGNPNRWDWNFGDGTTASGQQVSHTYTVPGTYQVCLEMENACGMQDTVCLPVQVIFVSAIGANNAISSLQVYPQPAQDRMQLDMEVQLLNDVAFDVLDVQGRKWMSWSERVLSGSYSHTLELAGLPAGMYFLSIRSKEGTHMLKLLVQ